MKHKKYIIGCLAVILCGAAVTIPFMGNAHATFADKLQSCEDTYARKLRDMPYGNHYEEREEMTRCLHDLIVEMLREYYASRADDAIAQFGVFFETANQMTLDAEYPDCCSPNCGTAAGGNATGALHDMLRIYATQLIRANYADMQDGDRGLCNSDFDD